MRTSSAVTDNYCWGLTAETTIFQSCSAVSKKTGHWKGTIVKPHCSNFGIIIGPGHAKACLMPFVNNKGADQPAHPCSLISTFVVRCSNSMIWLLATSKVSWFWLAFVAEQAGLNLTWSKILKDTLCFACCGSITSIFSGVLVVQIFTVTGRWFEPCHEKTCLRGFQPVKTQTDLCSQRS